MKWRMWKLGFRTILKFRCNIISDFKLFMLIERPLMDEIIIGLQLDMSIGIIIIIDTFKSN